jgi:hypothetical protein
MMMGINKFSNSLTLSYKMTFSIRLKATKISIDITGLMVRTKSGSLLIMVFQLLTMVVLNLRRTDDKHIYIYNLNSL